MAPGSPVVQPPHAPVGEGSATPGTAREPPPRERRVDPDNPFALALAGFKAK